MQEISEVKTFPKEGFLAPEFVLVDKEGNQHSLADYYGKPVVINFWASWCPPCRAEMPALQEVYSEYHPLGVVFLAINASNQDSPDAAVRFAEEVGVTFPVLFDVSGDTSSAYNLRALPSTYFVDKNGIINKVVIGGPLSKALLKSHLAELLKVND